MSLSEGRMRQGCQPQRVNLSAMNYDGHRTLQACVFLSSSDVLIGAVTCPGCVLFGDICVSVGLYGGCCGYKPAGTPCVTYCKIYSGTSQTKLVSYLLNLSYIN